MSSQNAPEPRGLLYILFSALGVLWLLSQFKKTPDKESIDSVSPKTKSHDHSSEGHYLPPFPSQIQPSPKRSENHCQCRHHKTPLWKISLDVATFLAVVVYAGFTYGILSQTKKSVQQVERQNTLIRQQVVGEQQAIVDAIVSLSETSLIFVATNNGHVPATDVQAKIEVTRKKLPSLLIISHDVFYMNDMPVLPGGQLNVNGTAYPLRSFTIPNFSKENWQAIMNTREVSFMDAEFSYNNGFGDIIPKHYCRFLLFIPEQNGKGRRPVEDNCNTFAAHWDEINQHSHPQ